MAAGDLPAVAAAPPVVFFVAAYPARDGVAWVVWRGAPSGAPLQHGFVRGRGRRLLADAQVYACVRDADPRAEVRWLDDECAAPFAGDRSLARTLRRGAT